MPDTVIASYRTHNSSEIKDLPIIKGSMILAKDTGAMYADTIDGDRVPISRQTSFISEAQRQAMLAPEEEILYITIDDFKIWIWFNNAWQCLTRELELNFMTNEDIDRIVYGEPTEPDTGTEGDGTKGDGSGETTDKGEPDAGLNPPTDTDSETV